MRLEHEKYEVVAGKIREIVAKYLDLNAVKIFFFGSRITGRGDDRSDIDVGIEGKNPIPRPVMYKIKEDMDNLPFLYKIDIVDFKDVPENFYKIAIQNILSAN